MSAWVSRVTFDEGEVNSRGKPKRRLERMEPGLGGVTAADLFLVMFLDPEQRLRQERIKLSGKPGKKLADRRAAQITSELTLGQWDTKDKTTWKEFRAELTGKFLPERSLETRRLYNESLDLFESICKPKLMRAIDNKTISDFKAGLRKRPGKKSTIMSPANINKHLRHVKAALRQGHKWDYVERMPEIDMVREPEKDPVFMEPEHFEAIYKSCGEASLPTGRPYAAADWWRALMITGIMTGMRIGEMLSLLWDDVFLDKGHLRVRHYRSKAKRDDTIPLHPLVVEHLRRITDVGLMVFDCQVGKKALFDEWHRIQRAAGIHVVCRENHNHTDTCHVYGFHSLKKACGTLNAGRLPETVLNAFMRHASRETTRKYYQNREKLLDGHVDSIFVPNIGETD